MGASPPGLICAGVANWSSRGRDLLDAKIISVGAANAGELGKTPENTPRSTFMKFSGHNGTLQANLDNATDRDYWATAGNAVLGTGASRTLRLAAKVDF